MKKAIVAGALMALLAGSLPAAARAAEKEGFWKNLWGRVDQITPRKKTFTTAVGGVRGAAQESTADLYWKGREHDIRVSEEELVKFKEALDAAITGKADQSIKMFQDFVELYPESALKEDALTAVLKLRTNPEALKESGLTPLSAPDSPAPGQAPEPAVAPTAPAAQSPASDTVFKTSPVQEPPMDAAPEPLPVEEEEEEEEDLPAENPDFEPPADKK